MLIKSSTYAGFFAWILMLLLSSTALSAQELIVEDLNGDDAVSILAFGDSLTYGVGDGTMVGAFVEEPPRTDGSQGYPARVSAVSGVPVFNAGIPAEELTTEGIDRLPLLVQGSSADAVILFEGTNDTIDRTDTSEYSRIMQKAVNVVRAFGKEPIIATLPDPCCNHDGRQPFTSSYTRSIVSLAAVNDVAVADVARAWRSTCENPSECELYNLPEGLHPNSRGYDVIAQVVLATLFGIDIFAADGADQLDAAFGLDPGTTIVKPGV